MVDKIKRIIKGYYWKCNNCGSIKDREEEVFCWECSKGEMIFTSLPHYKLRKLIYERFNL